MSNWIQARIYIPEHYKEPLAELRVRIAPDSFSKVMQSKLRDLFAEHFIPFQEKDKRGGE